jgi:hypothetical protein
MNYRIEKGEVVFYEGRDELQAVEPTCGMGHHPVEFGFKEVSEIFEYQDAELIKAAKEKDGGTYQIIQNGRDPFKKITSSTGETFYRRACGTAWARQGGTWSMTNGHHDRRNPHF